VGLYQMPCPQQRAWGGLLKRRMLRGYGLRDSVLYPLRGALFRLFVWHTRIRYRRMAGRVARDIEDCHRGGVRVLGVVGVGCSPSCGVNTTLDLRRSFEAMAACPLALVDRAAVNERVVVACRAACPSRRAWSGSPIDRPGRDPGDQGAGRLARSPSLPVSAPSTLRSTCRGRFGPMLGGALAASASGSGRSRSVPASWACCSPSVSAMGLRLAIRCVRSKRSYPAR
jgi:hypothetical protein